MLLTELFTQPAEYQITTQSSTGVTAEFDLDDNNYEMDAYTEPLREIESNTVQHMIKNHIPNADNIKIWQFEFAITKEIKVGDERIPSRRHNVTGTGNAATVFATMMHFIQYVVNQNNVRVIKFDSAKRESSRVKLYNRMVNTLAKKFNWESLITSDDEDDYYVYILYKEQQ